MTVCIAAICDEGAHVVAATDSALTMGGMRGDTLVPGKMVWFSDWLFLWSGEPGNIDLVLEKMRQMARHSKELLTRENIRRTVNNAFKQFVADWTSDYVLAPYDMDMTEFKKEGRNIFGEPLLKEISKQMNEAVKQYLNDELLVIGWGTSPHSALIHQRSAMTSTSHALTGVSAIGSGCEVALSTMIRLGQSRHTPLEQALYNVSAAKFMAEKSEGDGVGPSTGIFITRKRKDSDDPGGVVGHRIQSGEINQLKDLWEEFGKPRTPMEAMFPIEQILKSSGMTDFGLSTKTKMEIMKRGIPVPGGGMSF